MTVYLEVIRFKSSPTWRSSEVFERKDRKIREEFDGRGRTKGSFSGTGCPFFRKIVLCPKRDATWTEDQLSYSI